MNSSTQAQKGFKTFILTLLISLAVFSAIYYVVNSGSGAENEELPDINEVSSVNVNKETNMSGQTNKGEVAGVATNTDTPQEEATQESVFEELAATNVDIPTRQVLAETGSSLTTTTTTTTTTTKESTVPSTGLVSPTFGLIFSLIALSVAAYVFYLGPRRMALSSFEKELLEDLD